MNRINLKQRYKKKRHRKLPFHLHFKYGGGENRLLSVWIADHLATVKNSMETVDIAVVSCRCSNYYFPFYFK